MHTRLVLEPQLRLNTDSERLVLGRSVKRVTIDNRAIPSDVYRFFIIVTQDKIGGHTIDGWPSSVTWVGNVRQVLIERDLTSILQILTIDRGKSWFIEIQGINAATPESGGGGGGEIDISSLPDGSILQKDAVTQELIGLTGDNYQQLVWNELAGWVPMYPVIYLSSNNALSSQLATGTASGGNDRGTEARDFQITRLESTQVASANYSIIVGGRSNTANGPNAIVVGGASNSASYPYSGVFTGNSNSVLAPYSAIFNGSNQTIESTVGYSFIGSGSSNRVFDSNSAILTGAFNTVNSASSFIGTGASNEIQNTYCAILSGTSNIINGPYSIIGSGDSNTTADAHNIIGSGQVNSTEGDYCVIVSGNGNTARGGSFIGTGESNEASGIRSSIVCGRFNYVSGDYSTIAGGEENEITNSFCWIPGGKGASTHNMKGAHAWSSAYKQFVGDNQHLGTLVQNHTGNATPTVLTSDRGSVTVHNSLELLNHTAYVGHIQILAYDENNNVGAWLYWFVAVRAANAASISVPYSVVMAKHVTAGFNVIDPQIVATNGVSVPLRGTIELLVTGIAGRSINWIAEIIGIQTTR